MNFLASLPGTGMPGLKVSSHRAGARKSSEETSLHGYATPEALLTEAALELLVRGVGIDGTAQQGKVWLPHPFTADRDEAARLP